MGSERPASAYLPLLAAALAAALSFGYSQPAYAGPQTLREGLFGDRPAPGRRASPPVARYVSQEGEAASNANSLKQGQDVVLSALQQRFNDGSSVNIDQEMANLLTLQNAYAANARVLSSVKEMFDTLLKM